MDSEVLCEGFATEYCCMRCVLSMTADSLVLLPIARIVQLLHKVLEVSAEPHACPLIILDKCKFNCSGGLRRWNGQPLSRNLFKRGEKEPEFTHNKKVVCNALCSWKNISKSIRGREEHVKMLIKSIPSLFSCLSYGELLLQLWHTYTCAYLMTSEFTTIHEVYNALQVIYERSCRAYRLKLGCATSLSIYKNKTCGKCTIRLDNYHRLYQMHLAKVYQICSKICSICTVSTRVIDIDNSTIGCNGSINIVYKVLSESECDKQNSLDDVLTWNRAVICQIILSCSAYTHDSDVQGIQMKSCRLLGNENMLTLSSYFITASRLLENLIV